LTDLALDLLDIVEGAIHQMRVVIIKHQGTKSSKPGSVDGVAHDKQQLFRAIATAQSAGGMSQEDLRDAAARAGYPNLRSTLVYYRKTGTAHLAKTPDGKTVLTEAGTQWLHEQAGI
jgi:hypothetical protein